MDAELLRRLDLARDCLASAPLTLEKAAHGACLSQFHFHRQFVRAFGQTPHAFATERRLERAKALLLDTDLPVSEVCLKVGYASLGTFSTRFLREYGQTPGEYRAGVRRYWSLGGVRSHRFVPTCFLRYGRMENGKIRELPAPPPVLG